MGTLRIARAGAYARRTGSNTPRKTDAGIAARKGSV